MNDRGDRGAKRLDGNAAGNAGKHVQAHIGNQLRQMFDEVVQEPIPDRLKRLLADLDDTEKSNEADGAAKR